MISIVVFIAVYNLQLSIFKEPIAEYGPITPQLDISPIFILTSLGAVMITISLFLYIFMAIEQSLTSDDNINW